MQLHTFHNGSFVAHGVRISGRASRFSVWCDMDGTLRDAARIDSARRDYPVKAGSAAWRDLAKRTASYARSFRVVLVTAACVGAVADALDVDLLEC